MRIQIQGFVIPNMGPAALLSVALGTVVLAVEDVSFSLSDEETSLDTIEPQGLPIFIL